MISDKSNVNSSTPVYFLFPFICRVKKEMFIRVTRTEMNEDPPTLHPDRKALYLVTEMETWRTRWSETECFGFINRTRFKGIRYIV